jgi:hypothetical protein
MIYFKLNEYTAPEFSDPDLKNAPDAILIPVPMDGVAPDDYHTTTIFPEYFKVDGKWLLAEESRMDCIAVYECGRVMVREFRHLKKGDLVFTGRSEDGRQGIYLHTHGFNDVQKESGESFAFRQNRSRETAFSINYDFLYEQLRYEKENG